MRPILLRIPFVNIPLFAYGFCLLLGFLAGTYLARRRAAARGIDPELIYDLGVVLLFAGVAGARILFVIVNWDIYSGNILDVLKVWHGGMIFYGGLVTATAAGVWYLARRRVSVALIADIIAPSLMLGLAFGRIGCFMNGCCYGEPVNSSLSVRFPKITETGIEASAPEPRQYDDVVAVREKGNRIYVTRVVGSPAFLDQMHRMKDGKALVDPVHDEWSLPVLPTQLFECVGALGIALVLSLYLARKPVPGRVFIMMGILYPVLRFTVECFRGDNPALMQVWPATRGIPVIQGLSLSQNLSLAILLLSILLWWKARRA